MVAGRRTIILRDVQDVATVWRNTQALSIDPFVVLTLGAFGIGKPTLEKIFTDPRDLIQGQARMKSVLINSNPNNKVYMDLEREWFTSQLLAPEALRTLQKKYLAYLNESLSWTALSPTYVLSRASSPETTTVVSLRKFCQYTVSYCSTNTFFGKKLQQIAPDFLQHYQEFEKGSWKIFYRLPSFLAVDSHRAKERAVDGLAKYLSMPDQDHSELEWIFQTIVSELGYLGVGDQDIAAFVMVIIWAINNNAHKVAFWILAHLLHNQPYLLAVCDEIDAAFLGRERGSEGEPSMDILLSACPHLDAIWYETMRVYNATSVIRQATWPCTVGGKRVHVGDQLIAPFRQFHLNRDIFGHDATAFRPERFLENRTLPRTKGYAPFGGGYTYCPGRLFAQREIYLFVAMTLRRFEMGLVPRERGPRMPQVDKETPSAAAMSPDEDVLVLLQQRKHV